MSIVNKTDQQILEHIENNIQIHENAKNTYGEVFTKPMLIEELCKNIPLHVWKNPTTKWLDPAAGNGNFIAMIYKKLLHTLKQAIPNMKKRKQHILKNMLYMVEINPKNVRKLLDLFGKTANISKADFITERGKWSQDLGVDEFQIIMGNPPFQTSKYVKYKGSVGNRTLWDGFLDMILNKRVLATKGYLGFITPANWRRPDHPLYQTLIKDNSMRYLHIYGKKEGPEHLGAQTRFDLYVVQEGSSQSKTKVIDEKGKQMEVAMGKWPFFPNYAHDKIKKLLVPKNKGIKVIFDAGKYDARTLSKAKTKKNRHPIVHNITLRGLGLRYTKKRSPQHFGVPKVLLNFNEKQYPHNDFDGKYGMSQLTFGIPTKSKTHGEKIIKAINSKGFREILAASKWSAFQTDYRMFSYLDPNFYKDF